MISLSGDELLAQQLLVALVLALGGVELRLGALDAGEPLLHRLLQQHRIDAGEELALLHLVVEVGMDGRDLTGHLGPDLDRGDGAQGAGGRHRRLDVAALHRGEAVRRLLVVVGASVHPPAGQGQ